MMHSELLFDGKVCLITGAGSGIGRALALQLSSLGASVVITELPAQVYLADGLAAQIQSSGGRALSLPLDVTVVSAIPNVFAAAVDHFGRLDVLVNNAGVTVLKAALEVDEAEFDKVIEVNLKGAFFCAQAAARLMRHGGGGNIVNIASQHGVVGNVNRAPYCASKAGLINLTRALALEWAALNIRVNAVSPTFVDNGHNAVYLQEPGVAAEIKGKTPLGRVATAMEVASAVCYLASSQASMVTGHNLVVDGGWTAQ